MSVGTFDVYTVGGIEYLSQVYKGMVLILGDSSWDTFTKIFITAGIISAISLMLRKNDVKALSSWLLAAFIGFGMFVGVKADVNIVDTKHNKTYVVSGVPVGPVFLHSLFSSGSYTATETLGNVFHTGTVNVWSLAGGSNNAFISANLDYHSTGFGGFFDPILEAKRMQFNRLPHPDVIRFNNMLDAFLYQCTMPEMSVLTTQQVETRFKSSTNLMDAIAPTVNQFMNYEGTLTTCTDLYINQLRPLYDNTILPLFDPGTSGILAVLGIKETTANVWSSAINESLVGSAQTLNQLIGQAGMISAIDYAYMKYVSGGTDSGGDLAMAYQTGRSREEARQLGKAFGLYAKEVVPMLKIALESIYIILCPIIVLLMFLNNFSILKHYAFAVAWLHMWDPVFAVINGLMNIGAIARMHTALEAANAVGGLSINALNLLVDTADFVPAVAGYLGISVPAIALMVMKGGEMTMAHIGSQLLGGAVTAPSSGAAQHAGAQEVAAQTGSSFGEVQMAQLSRPWEIAANLGNRGDFNKYGARTFASMASFGNARSIAGMNRFNADYGAYQAAGGTMSKDDFMMEAQSPNVLFNISPGRVNDGSLSFTLGKGGQAVHADHKNLDFDISQTKRDALSRIAAHDLAYNENFMKAVTSGADLAKSYGVTTAFSEKLLNSYQQSLGNELRQNTSFTDSVKSAVDKQLAAEGGISTAGIPIIGNIIQAGAGYRVTGTTANGKSFNVTIGSSSVDSFSDIQSKAMENALTRTASDQQSIHYARQIASQVGDSEAWRSLEQAMSEKGVNLQEKADLETNFINHLANNHPRFKHIDDPVQRYREVRDHIDHLYGSGPGGQKILFDQFGEFAEDYYNGMLPKNNVSAQVDAKLSAGGEVKSEVLSEAAIAGGKVAGISEGAVSKDPRVRLDSPDRAAFGSRKADTDTALKDSSTAMPDKPGLALGGHEPKIDKSGKLSPGALDPAVKALQEKQGKSTMK